MGVLHWQEHRYPRQCLIPLSVGFEVSRERVFILATKPGFHFEVAVESTFLLKTVQAVDLEPAEAFARACKSEWNAAEKPPLHSWLSSSLDTQAQSRLHSLQNIVFPKQAHFALNVLEASIRSET